MPPRVSMVDGPAPALDLNRRDRGARRGSMAMNCCRRYGADLLAPARPRSGPARARAYLAATEATRLEAVAATLCAGGSLRSTTASEWDDFEVGFASFVIASHRSHIFARPVGSSPMTTKSDLNLNPIKL